MTLAPSFASLACSLEMRSQSNFDQVLPSTFYAVVCCACTRLHEPPCILSDIQVMLHRLLTLSISSTSFVAEGTRPLGCAWSHAFSCGFGPSHKQTVRVWQWLSSTPCLLCSNALFGDPVTVPQGYTALSACMPLDWLAWPHAPCLRRLSFCAMGFPFPLSSYELTSPPSAVHGFVSYWGFGSHLEVLGFASLDFFLVIRSLGAYLGTGRFMQGLLKPGFGSSCHACLEVLPLRSAGFFSNQYRQILLLTLRPPVKFWVIECRLCRPRVVYFCQFAGRDVAAQPSISRRFPPQSPGHRVWESISLIADSASLVYAALLVHLQRAVLQVQDWLHALVTSCFLIGLFGLAKLLSYGASLKGGRCNIDPLLRGLRAVTAPFPLQFAAPLTDYPPRLRGSTRPSKLLDIRAGRTWCHIQAWLIFLTISICIAFGYGFCLRTSPFIIARVPGFSLQFDGGMPDLKDCQFTPLAIARLDFVPEAGAFADCDNVSRHRIAASGTVGLSSLMWSPAFFARDAQNDVGKPGDTPPATVSCGSDRHFHGTPLVRLSRCTWQPLLYLFLQAHFAPVCAGAILPVYHDLCDSDGSDVCPVSSCEAAPFLAQAEADGWYAGASRHETWASSSVCTDSHGFVNCAPELSNFEVGPLVTLLEAAKDDCFDLVCQFVADLIAPASALPAAASEPQSIFLDQAIPRTPFQEAVNLLQVLLPSREPVAIEAWHDWLDCDLSPVQAECRSCPSVWAWLSAFGSWYDDPFQPDCVHVYTDGSAGQKSSGLLAPASWAFNAWAIGPSQQAYLGHAFGITVDAQSPFYLGESDDDALTGEQLAIAWALSWIVEASCAFCNATFVVHFDNLAAGEGGFGRFRLPACSESHLPTRLSRNVAVLRHCAQAVCQVLGRHVPSHSGFAGNELADILAKFAGKHPEPDDVVCRPICPNQITSHALAEWAWLALRDTGDLPGLCAFESEASRLFANEARRPYTFSATPLPEKDGCNAEHPELSVKLRLCSLNALSIREHDDLPQGLAVVGKRALLKQQFSASQLHVIAFQETRTQGDCVQPDADYIMLHSSCEASGSCGCAIWLSKALPVVVSQHHTTYFTRETCTVLVATPRLLLVQADLPGLPLTFVSAHAPHDGHKQQTAEHFWQEVGRVVAKRPSGAQLVVLADSNGHLGAVSSDAVGTAGAEVETSAGAAFHSFLTSFGLCLPSTFEALHSGGHWTWRVGSGAGHRLDYVAAPVDWLVGGLSSQVWYDFDHIHDVDDHQPVLLHCDLLRSSVCWQPSSSRKAPRPQVDTDPGQLQCFRYAASILPGVAWHVDVDSHYAAFVRSTLWCWSAYVQQPPRQRSQPFISQNTLAAFEHRKCLRQFLLAEEASLAYVRKLIGVFAFWLQWRHSDAADAQVQLLGRLLRHGRQNIATAVGFLGRIRVFLRKAVRADRATYLRRLADGVSGSSLQQPKQLFAAVYRAFPVVRAKRRSGFCPLPAVQLADGTRAVDASARLQRWTEHFAQQEGGVVVTAKDYDREVCSQAPCPNVVPQFDIHCVPTLVDVEQDLLKLAKGKAAGPDLITADLLQLDVPTVSIGGCFPSLRKLRLHVESQ